MNQFKDAVEVDFHNFRLIDAEVEICLYIEDAWKNGGQSILFNHGIQGREDIEDHG